MAGIKRAGGGDSCQSIKGTVTEINFLKDRSQGLLARKTAEIFISGGKTVNRLSIAKPSTTIKAGVTMYGIIYRATGPTGKVYIGQTVKSLAKRKSQHKFMTLKGDRRTAFHIALLDEGFDNFAWEQIDAADTAEELSQKEKRWIAHYKSSNPAHGYNHTDGGIKTIYSPEACKKISEALKGRRLSVEHCQKNREARKGKHHTAETKRKMSEAHKGINTWTKGRKLSPETRRKLSEAMRGEKSHCFGKHLSIETRKKISETKRGTTLSEETCRRMSDSRRGEKSCKTKITETTAREIKADLRAGLKICNIAKKYNIAKSIVANIKYGTSWAWLKVS
jgi:group I intron endonuclease